MNPQDNFMNVESTDLEWRLFVREKDKSMENTQHTITVMLYLLRF